MLGQPPFFKAGKQIARIDKVDINLYRLSKYRFLRILFYFWFKPNPEVIEAINSSKQRGDQIVVISGHSDRCVDELESCLTKAGMLLDGIHLITPERFASYLQFKLQTIMALGCDVYIEDLQGVVEYLRAGLGTQCKVVHYSGPDSLPEVKRALIH